MPPATNRGRLKTTLRRATQWVMLFGLWCGLSGDWAVEFLVAGALAAAGAIALSERLFRGTNEGQFTSAPEDVLWFLRTGVKFFVYLPWLAWQIVYSNLHVVYLVLHPKMPIDPKLIEFRTTLKTEVAQIALAQSITLTPGTVTVDASNGLFLVHCLSAQTRQGMVDGTLQKRVAQVFDEPWEEPVEVTDIDYAHQVTL